MKVGFTGTRQGMSQHQKEQFVLLVQKLNPVEFHHGDCEGADADAHDIVRAFFPDTKIVIHSPISFARRAGKQGDEYRQPEMYLKRDENIIKETDYLVACPLTDTEEIRSGTWATIRYSRKADKPRAVLER